MIASAHDEKLVLVLDKDEAVTLLRLANVPLWYASCESVSSFCQQLWILVPGAGFTTGDFIPSSFKIKCDTGAYPTHVILEEESPEGNHEEEENEEENENEEQDDD